MTYYTHLASEGEYHAHQALNVQLNELCTKPVLNIWPFADYIMLTLEIAEKTLGSPCLHSYTVWFWGAW